jgi:hypothetical protein
MTDWMSEFGQAIKMDPLALLRHRAECLLRRVDNPTKRPESISEGEREELTRVASAPREGDSEFLTDVDIYTLDMEEKQKTRS